MNTNVWILKGHSSVAFLLGLIWWLHYGFAVEGRFIWFCKLVIY